MKQFLTIFFFAAAFFGFPVAQAHEVTYTAVLEGPNESPPNASPGLGTATITIDFDLLTMDVTADFSGLLGATTASHIHCCTAAPDTGTAGVATSTPTFPGFPLGVSDGSYSHLFHMDLSSSYNTSFITAHGSVGGAFSALIAGLDADEAYFNIHTNLSPAGEIRGFLHAVQAVPEPGSLALLGLGLAGLGFSRRRQRVGNSNA